MRVHVSWVNSLICIVFIEISPPRGQQAYGEAAEEGADMSADEFRRANQFLNNVSSIDA